MYAQVYSTAEVVVEEERKEGNLHPMNYTCKIQTNKQTQNEKDTWVPSLENWESGLKIFYGYIKIFNGYYLLSNCSIFIHISMSLCFQFMRACKYSIQHAAHHVTSDRHVPTDLVNFSPAVIRSRKGFGQGVVMAEAYLMKGRGGGWSSRS